MNTQIVIPKLHEDSYLFPDPLKAPDNGLLAWGGDLHPRRLIKAYKEGIFPWFSPGDPLLWWSPNPRLLLFPESFRVTKSLKKSRKKFSLHVNKDFETIIQKCKTTREEKREGTWITEQMLDAYVTLHHMGYAKSIECYEGDELVGGLYGILIGSVFCGESMFSTKSDASKVALWHLCELIKKSGGFIDCQNPTTHLQSLGAKAVAREEFLQKLFTCRDKKVDLT